MKIIPYAKQDISNADIDAVVKVLRSEMLTQGPMVPRFEEAIAKYSGSKYTIAMNSATSALHVACMALDLGSGDWLWTSANTYVASSNCALYCNASVEFIDIDPCTYNICVDSLEQKLKKARHLGCLPKILIPVHYAGQSCDMVKIHSLSKEYGFRIVEDASHAIGGKYHNEAVGACRYSDITIFSFHPVKIITTGEGGAALTNDSKLANLMSQFRSHGITSEQNQMSIRPKNEIWNYQQIRLGYNYRMTDIQAALGLSQMSRIDEFIESRNKIANYYDKNLISESITIPKVPPNTYSSYHLYPIRVNNLKGKVGRNELFNTLKKAGILVNIHYIPVYRHPYYETIGFKKDYCPEAELFYQEEISLPMHPALSKNDQDYIIRTIMREFKVK